MQSFGWLSVVPADFGWLWGDCGWFWLVLGGCGLLLLVLAGLCCLWVVVGSFSWLLLVARVFACVCLQFFTVKASSVWSYVWDIPECTNQWSCVVSVILGASAKIFISVSKTVVFHLQRQNSSRPTNWR